jgi:hypothetical protein
MSDTCIQFKIRCREIKNMKHMICDKKFKIASGAPIDLSTENVCITILRICNRFIYLKTEFGYAEIGH